MLNNRGFKNKGGRKMKSELMKWRKERGLKQYEVAELFGVCRGASSPLGNWFTQNSEGCLHAD